LTSLNIVPESVSLPDLLTRLRSHAERVKRPVGHDELMQLMTIGAE